MQEAFRKVLVKMSCPAKVLPAESGSPAEVALRREIVYTNGTGGSVRSRWVSYTHGLHGTPFQRRRAVLKIGLACRVLCVTS